MNVSQIYTSLTGDRFSRFKFTPPAKYPRRAALGTWSKLHRVSSSTDRIHLSPKFPAAAGICYAKRTGDTFPNLAALSELDRLRRWRRPPLDHTIQEESAYLKFRRGEGHRVWSDITLPTFRIETSSCTGTIS